MTILRSPEIEHRNDFAKLCNRRGLHRYAVEVGVERAEYSVKFRDAWNGDMLLCIDPWQKSVEGYGELRWERESDYQMALARLSRCERFVEVFRGTLDEAIQGSRIRRSIDFLYLDADHSYEFMQDAIAKMWPLMAPHGIMAGHDFDVMYRGTIRAVAEHGERVGVPIYTTHEVRFKSWYCYRHDQDLFGKEPKK